jgi:uncharacterized protein
LRKKFNPMPKHLNQRLPAGIVPTGDQFPPENLAAKGEVPRRRFGRTDEIVSAMGLGGATFAGAKTKSVALRIVHEAIDNGITFMDNAWDYHDGKSEKWMGEALQGRRDQVFLMTKCCSHGRDKKVALKQLEESLRRLRTDYLDLWQLHEVAYENDPELHFMRGGAAEALLEARKQGKVRFIGFTGHKKPELHLKMLAHDFPFDSVQMPLSGFDAGFRSFEREVLPVLVQRGIAPIGMKSLNGTGDAIKQGVITVEAALRYAMSLPVTTTVSGIDSLAVLRQNLKIARNFVPMTPQEKGAHRKECVAYAADGRFEMYKVSIYFDGAEGRKQHGFPSEEKVSA